MIGYGRQSINQQDIDDVVDCLKSDYLTQGPIISKFENALLAYCGADYCVATNSATSALHIACLALGVTTDDVVWTVANTFVASANCAKYCGADVKFVDIDLASGNIDINVLEHMLIESEGDGTLPKVLIPVHFAGAPCDMNEINRLKERFGFSVIEDASHALGAQYDGHHVGNGHDSDITIFSFHPVKMITSAEGGAALTNSEALAQRMRLFSNHGITRSKGEFTHLRNESWYYEQQSLGYNYRMSEIHAALGLSQLRRIDEFLAKRSSLVTLYRSLLGLCHGIDFQSIASGSVSSNHLFTIRVREEIRESLSEFLKHKGIGTQVHYYPVDRQPFHDTGIYTKNAMLHAMTTLSLPLFVDLEEENVVKISSLIVEFIESEEGYETEIS